MKTFSVSSIALLIGLMAISVALPNMGNNVAPTSRGLTMVKSSSSPKGYYSDSWPANSGYHNYGYYAIDASGIPDGGYVTINYQAYNNPNVFTVLDNCSMGTATNSGWQGQASYPGPWGMSLNNASSGSVSLKKQGGCNTYRFQVETSTSSSVTDNWVVSN